MPKPVVIVGAGLSGLTCAHRLNERGVEVVVLEGRNRVGGRAHVERVHDEVVDLGGQWLGPTQDRAMALAQRLGLELFPQHERGKKLVEWNGRMRSYRGLLPRIPAVHLAELGLRMLQVDRWSATVDPKQPWAHARSTEWDQMTVADWLGRVRTKGARDSIAIATQMIFAAEPEELSFLFFLSYLAGGGGITPMASIRNGAQMWRIAGGAVQMCDGLVGELGPVVRFEQAVRAVRCQADHLELVTDRETIIAERAVFAMSPALIERIPFSPELPAARLALQAAMPMGSVIKCVIGYPQPFWRERGLSGEVISASANLRAVFDDCSANGKMAALVAFVVGESARRLTGLEADERQRLVVADLVRFFGESARHPSFYVDKDWPADPFSGGCFTGVMGPGTLTSHGPLLRAPVGRIHFAGTETARVWQGYFEGAIEAGERAAEEILAARPARSR